MPSGQKTAPHSFATALRLVATLSAAYGLSQFLRASAGVIAPELAVDLDLGPEDLGSLTGAFFFVFALAQLPVGIALDRWGPRRVLLSLVSVTVAGCLVFAMAESVTGLIAGRMLMGLGCASMLMGPYVIYGREFDADRFAQLSSIQLGVGYVGALIATTPLAFAAEVWGWRSVFVAAGGAAVVFALMTGAVVTKGMGRTVAARHHGLADDLAGVVHVMKLRALWPVIPMNMMAYGSVATILTLWGGPYFSDVHGLPAVERGNFLLAMWVSAILGLLIFGVLERRVSSRKRLVVAGAIANAFCLIGIAIWPDAPLPVATGILCLAAFTNGITIPIAAHIRRTLPHALMGRGLTFMNMGMMMGVALLQVILGWIAERGSAGDSVLNASVYSDLFAFLGLTLILSTLWFGWLDRRLKRDTAVLTSRN